MSKSAVYMQAYTEFLTVVKDGISARQVKTVRNRYHERFFTLVSTHPLSLTSCCPLFFATTRRLRSSQTRSVTIIQLHLPGPYFFALKTLKENNLQLLGPSFTYSSRSKDRLEPQYYSPQRQSTKHPIGEKGFGLVVSPVWSWSNVCVPGSDMNNVLPGLHLNLPPLDPKSDEFTDTFRSSLLPADERQRILELSDEDAKAFIEIIDKVCSP